MAKRGGLTPHGKLVRRYVRVPARKLTAEMTEKLIQTRERQAQALDLRRAGATFDEIARVLKYSHRSAARQAVMSAIERIGIEPAVDVVAMDLMRLDEFQKRLTDAMRKGDLGVIPTLMNVMRERRALVGWSPETWEEEQRKGKGIQNNGVMVIQGGSVPFIEGMMKAVGLDPKSPEAQRELARVRSEEEKAGTGEFAINGPTPSQILASRSADSALNQPLALEAQEIVEAEIVDE